jgi:hypothetical protein
MFIAPESNLIPVVSDIVVGSLLIRMNDSTMGGINSLNYRQRSFIENWEAQNFRINLVAKKVICVRNK